MSINWKKSAELNNCTIDELKARFKRFPQSAKRVIVICGDCNKEREISFYDYCDLCSSCATKKVYEDPLQREKTSIAGKHANKDDPTISQRKRESMKKRFDEMDDPGLEIVNHHIAYDFDHPENLTVQIASRFHSSIHHPKGIPVTERGYSLID